jgi:hypothetical protein
MKTSSSTSDFKTSTVIFFGTPTCIVLMTSNYNTCFTYFVRSCIILIEGLVHTSPEDEMSCICLTCQSQRV